MLNLSRLEKRGKSGQKTCLGDGPGVKHVGTENTLATVPPEMSRKASGGVEPKRS